MLYYESHVTIEPVFGEDLDRAQRCAELYGFKVADLLMKRERDESEKRSDKDTFMTSRSVVFHDIVDRTIALVKALGQDGFQVWRYKIEDTIIDSRESDDFGLIRKVD